MWHEKNNKKRKRDNPWYVTTKRWDQPRNGAGAHLDKRKERERRRCRIRDEHQLEDLE